MLNINSQNVDENMGDDLQSTSAIPTSLQTIDSSTIPPASFEVPLYMSSPGFAQWRNFDLNAPAVSESYESGSHDSTSTGPSSLGPGSWPSMEQIDISAMSKEALNSQFPVPTESSSSTADRGHHQRIYNQQRTRYAGLEKVNAKLREDNAELRGVNRDNHMDLQSVLETLETIIIGNSTPHDISESLSNVCDILGKMDGRFTRSM